ncbi:MAG: ComEC/Rec2 family competence protein [Verrucomicrobium sp.]
MKSRPLIGHALAAVAGILIADAVRPAGLALAGASVAGFVAGVIACRRRGKSPVPLLLLTLFAFAAIQASALLRSREHPLRVYLERRNPSDGLTVIATGRVEKALRRDLPGSIPREEYFVATEVEAPTLGIKWHGPVVLRLVTGQEENLPAGRYRFSGFLRLPREPDNPGQFNERAYDLRLGLAAELRSTTIASLAEDRWNIEAGLIRAAEQCRLWVGQALQKDLEDAPKEYAVILAMVMGTIDADSADLRTPFRLSGTLHIFSVSGLHVAIVGLILWKFLKVFGLSRGPLLAILIPVLFGYTFITGLSPSAVRAAVMAAVFLCGALVHRKGDLLNSLAAAALLLLAYDSQQLFSAGFQLSFAVLAAIALLAEPFKRPFEWWIAPDPYLPRSLLNFWQRASWKGRRELCGLFTVSAAAWVGSLPLTLAHFQSATPISLVANIILVPLSFLVLFTAVLTLMSAAVHLTWIQVLFSNANFLLAGWTINSAVFFASIPGGNFRVPSRPWEARAPMEMTVLRVSEGGAAQHLRAAGSHWLLDTGSEDDFRFLVRPYLQSEAVGRLAGVVVSHSDIGHVGGAAATWREFQPPNYYHSSREPWRWDGSHTSFKRLSAEPWPGKAIDFGGWVELSPAPGTAKAKVLYPTPDLWPRRADDRTLVMRVDLGNFRVLWCGDAGFVAEKAMLERWAKVELKADVIIRNRHASDAAFQTEFIMAVEPRAVIASNQSFPAGQELPLEVTEICARLGIRLFDQAKTGAVKLAAWPDRLELSAYRAGSERLVLAPQGHGVAPK